MLAAQDIWADFGSDSPLPAISGVFPSRGWSQQTIGPNDPVDTLAVISKICKSLSLQQTLGSATKLIIRKKIKKVRLVKLCKQGCALPN